MVVIGQPVIFVKTVSPIYGFWGGGNASGGPSNVIDQIDITTVTVNASDVGDLTVARATGGIRGILYGFAGGSTNVIDYITLITKIQNAIDRGDFAEARTANKGMSGTVYGFFAGGYTSWPTMSPTIEYIDVTATTGNAVDKGDMTQAGYLPPAIIGPTYGYFVTRYCGAPSYASNVIDYINRTTTTGNATDVGDATEQSYAGAGVSGATYGYRMGGGGQSNVIDYINITSTSQNATDRGDLTVARRCTGVTGSVYGFAGGGGEDNYGTIYDIIDYIDLVSTSGNAIDRGDLTVARSASGGM